MQHKNTSFSHSASSRAEKSYDAFIHKMCRNSKNLDILGQVEPTLKMRLNLVDATNTNWT